MQIYHVVYDYPLLIKIAGPDFVDAYWGQFEGDGVESMVKLPDTVKCHSDSLNDFEAVRHVVENGEWPLWLSGVFTQESDIERTLRCNEATEMIDALWEPAVVGTILSSYYSADNRDDVLGRLFTAICQDRHSSGRFSGFGDFHDYVSRRLRPWIFAGENGYAIGYQSG